MKFPIVFMIQRNWTQTSQRTSLGQLELAHGIACIVFLPSRPSHFMDTRCIFLLLCVSRLAHYRIKATKTVATRAVLFGSNMLKLLCPRPYWGSLLQHPEMIQRCNPGKENGRGKGKEGKNELRKSRGSGKGPEPSHFSKRSVASGN